MTRSLFFGCWIFVVFTGSILCAQSLNDLDSDTDNSSKAGRNDTPKVFPYKNELQRYFSTTKGERGLQIGAAHGAGEVTEDLLQAVGQVVVDKATGAGFAAVKAKIQSYLGCDTGDPAFPQTCVVLDNLRLEEITTSYNALYTALLGDIGSLIVKDTISCTAIFKKVAGNLMAVLFIELSQPRRGISADISAMIVGGLQAFFNENADSMVKMDTNGHAILLAAAALLVAQEMANDPTYERKLEEIDIAGIVANVNSALDSNKIPRDSVQYSRAVRVASNFLEALTSKKGYAVDVRSRVAAALDAFVEIALMFEGGGLDDRTKAVSGKYPAWKVFVFRDIIGAIIYKDVNALVIATCTGIQKGMIRIKNDQDTSDMKRGVRLIGAVLLYAETYADTGISKEQAQASRTSILTSLVQDRTASDGWVFSVGGSLRGICTWRIPRLDHENKVTRPFWGVSLPIGFGADWYFPCHTAVIKGLHFDINPFDLGQFTSYTADRKIVVQKPDLADVFYPSMTAGLMFFSTNYPVVACYNLGYSPNYSAPEGSPLEGGTINHAVVLGIYVPLYDFK